MAQPHMPTIPGAAVMTDTLDFVKNLWGSMSVPGMGIPGITAPTLSVEDLDKKINDLKAVEAWLNLNMSMLRGSIQALEVQRGTIVTLKSMGASFAAAVKQPGATEKSLFETVPYASAFFHQAAAPDAPPAKAEAKTELKPAQEASAAAPVNNPAVWWNLLQDQFKQAVSTAMASDAAPSASAAKSSVESAAKPASKPAVAADIASASVKAPAKKAPAKRAPAAASAVKAAKPPKA
ncbi:hypothetical protein AAKU55_003817 [Oxalobacteraceae bacterium GrIS 1.11]